MTKLGRFLRRFTARRDGATTVEYAVITGLIFVTIVAAVIALGNGVSGLFGTASEELGAAQGVGGGEEGEQD